MRTDIGINVPQDVGGTAAVDHLRAFVKAADAEGFDSFWVSESVKPDVMDPLAILNFAASATRNAKLGVAVLLAAYRAPLQLARELATSTISAADGPSSRWAR